MSRVFVLTGAASGIGRHLAGVLAGLGDRVLATDVNSEALKAAAALSLRAISACMKRRSSS